MIIAMKNNPAININAWNQLNQLSSKYAETNCYYCFFVNYFFSRLISYVVCYWLLIFVSYVFSFDITIYESIHLKTKNNHWESLLQVRHIHELWIFQQMVEQSTEFLFGFETFYPVMQAIKKTQKENSSKSMPFNA